MRSQDPKCSIIIGNYLVILTRKIHVNPGGIATGFITHTTCQVLRLNAEGYQ
jgi:hypothetical protein